MCDVFVNIKTWFVCLDFHAVPVRFSPSKGGQEVQNSDDYSATVLLLVSRVSITHRVGARVVQVEGLADLRASTPHKQRVPVHSGHQPACAKANAIKMQRMGNCYVWAVGNDLHGLG